MNWTFLRIDATQVNVGKLSKFLLKKCKKAAKNGLYEVVIPIELENVHSMLGGERKKFLEQLIKNLNEDAANVDEYNLKEYNDLIKDIINDLKCSLNNLIIIKFDIQNPTLLNFCISWKDF